MASNGPVAIQGCAYRITRLNMDGSCAVSAIGMVQDDRSLVKLEAKPVMQAGVEITPVSACGVPVISYKDCDRYKRWEIKLSLGDFDPEKMELIGQGAIITAPGSSGRAFNDGAVAQGEYYLNSPAAASFTASDVGRTVAAANVPGGTTIVEYISATQVRMSATATASASGESVTLGAVGTQTIGYQDPHLLLVACPFGVSIEIWSKLIVRGTGFQGTVGYPTVGTPTSPGSAYMRTGIFRTYLWHDANSIENKEIMTDFTGWAIENPNFATGPVDDWRTGAMPGSAGGTPVDTTAWRNMMADPNLPSPLQPGYQAVSF